MITGDFHTHTVYCDGKNTPREMVERAIEMGLSALGFSGHGLTTHDSSFCMTEENTAKYIKEITALKEEFDGKIDILLGLEADLHSVFDRGLFDYVIGSVHYYEKDGLKIGVDDCAERTLEAAILFGGTDELARMYFNDVARVKTVTGCDIIGHFDLLSKFDETKPVFLPYSKAYKDSAIDAVDELLKTDAVFEVNTGAISRGYRTAPYPAPFILKRICEKGGSVILTGDAHSKDTLCYKFDEAIEYVRECGFDSVKTLTKSGFKDIKI